MRRIASSYLDDLRGKITLSDLVMRDAPLLRAGREWKGLCPFHNERTASFFVNDHKQFFNCFGCGSHGDAVTWLMRRRGLSFEQSVTELEALAGQAPMSDAQKFEANMQARAAEHAARETRRYELSDDQRSRQAQARAIWRNAASFSGTLAETYLRSRGIRGLRWPPCLRFTERAWHGWERTERPALIAALQDSNDQISAIQTIFLRPDGMGKAGVVPAKPVTGPMSDGAVRLAKPGPTMGVAEGIETALSARQLYSLPVWATLGASRLGAVRLPVYVTDVVIFADNGERGKAEAIKARDIYQDQERRCLIEYPPDGIDDFNTLVQQSTRAA